MPAACVGGFPAHARSNLYERVFQKGQRNVGLFQYQRFNRSTSHHPNGLSHSKTSLTGGTQSDRDTARRHHTTQHQSPCSVTLSQTKILYRARNMSVGTTRNNIRRNKDLSPQRDGIIRAICNALTQAYRVASHFHSPDLIFRHRIDRRLAGAQPASRSCAGRTEYTIAAYKGRTAYRRHRPVARHRGWLGVRRTATSVAVLGCARNAGHGIAAG